MTVVSRSDLVLIGAVIAFICATINVATKEALAAENQSQPHITFNSSSYTLEKTKTDVKSDRDGWTETAEWQSTQDEAYVFVNIFAHVSYNKVIMNYHVRPPEKRVHDITGSDGLVLGAKSRVAIEKGFYEYQIYSLNGVQCAYIQSYWGDKNFGGVDMVRGAKASDTIVGNHMLQAVFCDQHKKDMSIKDVTEVLSNIDLRDAYWPPNWFGADTDSAVPGATSTKTTLDNQATVEPRQDTGPEGVSGIYRSDITSNISYMFRHTKHRRLMITLKQKGNRITGADNSTGSEISGTVEGDTIKFEFWSKQIPYLSVGVSGEWKVIDDVKRLEGFWGSPETGSSSGKWNLTRIE